MIVLQPRPVLASPPFLLSDDEDERLFSRNQKFYALPSSSLGATVVYRVAKPRPTELYRIPGYHPTAYVSDDGEYVVLGYYGNNLLELNTTPQEAMLRFYKRGSLIKTIILSELIERWESLLRSPRSYSWGHYGGFLSLRRFVVDTVEGRRLTYDVATGKLVSSEFVKDLLPPPRR